MFGYVRYDLPNLFIKDFELYKAMYCGLCKGVGASCGQMSRMGLSYDVTFLSALLHNMMGVNIKIEKQSCVAHSFKKRPMACVDDLTRELGALNTVLVYYKLTDDINDKGRGHGRRLWFKKGFKRAKKAYPELVSIVAAYMEEQAKAEREKTASPDASAEPTACMLQRLSEHFLKEKSSEDTKNLFYAIGKWVYLIDALDDFEKDKRKGDYNPFVLSYPCKNRQELMGMYGEELAFLFDTLFFAMRESLGRIPFHFNRDLTDNIILRGIPCETARVMQGLHSKKQQNKL